MPRDPDTAAALATLKAEVAGLHKANSKLDDTVASLTRTSAAQTESIAKLYSRFMVVAASVLTLILTAAPDAIAVMLKIVGTFR